MYLRELLPDGKRNPGSPHESRPRCDTHAHPDPTYIAQVNPMINKFL